jgi:ABC-type multidrug transport system ATPase subunit
MTEAPPIQESHCDVEIALPVDVDFRWEDLYYSVPASHNVLSRLGCGPKKEILRGTSGAVSAGRSLAIIGASGAGKSTLLDILANRKGMKRGALWINDEPLEKKHKHLIGYVEQHDSLFDRLTIRESLLYSARLRNASSMPNREKKRCVCQLLRSLGLEACADTPIGNLSGGERKRTSIAMELVTTPPLFLLDEPTTGLDALSALNLAQLLQQLCRRGHSIVASLHQPSNAILQCFDTVMFLRDGKLEPFAVDRDAAAAPPAAVADLESVPAIVRSRSFRHDGEKTTTATPEQAGYLQQVLILCHRQSVVTIRSPDLFWGIMVVVIVWALISSTLFWRVGASHYVPEAGLVRGFLTASLILLAYISLQCISQVLQERPIFLRERASGYFQVGAYSLGWFLPQLAVLLSFAVVYSSISYWMVGLVSDAGAFFFFVLVVFSTIFTAQGMALLVASLIPNVGVALSLMGVLLGSLVLVSGFFIPREFIPPWWIWAYWSTMFPYAFEAAMLNQFLSPKVGPFVTCSDGSCPELSGAAVLDILGVPQNLDKFVLVAILLGFGVIFRFAAYLALRFVRWK